MTWLHTPDDLTDRYTRQWGAYTLTVSRALFRWWWTITDELGTQDQSEPMFDDAEAAMLAAEQVADVLTRARRLEGQVFAATTRNVALYGAWSRLLGKDVVRVTGGVCYSETTWVRTASPVLWVQLSERSE